MKKRSSQTHKKRTHSSQEGFISTDLKKLMSKNEKIIMAVLIGGIVIFLILSVVLLFNRGEDITTQVPATTAPQQRVNTTPYPTIPPIEDMTVMINERRLNPQTVTIKSGNAVSFFNIGANSIIIEGVDANSSFLNFTVQATDTYEYIFRNTGNFSYRVRGTNLVGTIIVQ